MKRVLRSWVKQARSLTGKIPFIDTLAHFVGEQNLQQTKKKLDLVGPGFCAAKWLQGTVHLELGETHSCEHPARHKMEESAVEKNASALYHTQIKIEAREEMLDGKRPSECSYCWEIEDLKHAPYSDRHYRSSQEWAYPSLDKIKSTSVQTLINPTYLEVSFSSTCNLKCSYCDPSVSSSIKQDIEKYGPFPTSDKFGTLKESSQQGSFFVNAFWKWWPELKDDLQVLRITGGEPLLHADLDKLLEELQLHQKGLKLSVHSNYSLPAERVEVFANKMKTLLENSNLTFGLHVSLDTWGAQAEYLRDGLDLKLLTKNLERTLDLLPTIDVTFMVTFNALSVFAFPQLLDYLAWLKRKYPLASIKLDLPRLRSPSFLSVEILPPQFEHYFKKISDKLVEQKFSFEERKKFKRIHQWWTSNHLDELPNDFLRFINEYDRRRHKSFVTTFPEMRELR